MLSLMVDNMMKRGKVRELSVCRCIFMYSYSYSCVHILIYSILGSITKGAGTQDPY